MYPQRMQMILQRSSNVGAPHTSHGSLSGSSRTRDGCLATAIAIGARKPRPGT